MIELAYKDDATSMETCVEIVDPTTGERDGFVCDNLTHVMYFLVANDLRPTREGLREPGRLVIPTNLPEDVAAAAEDISAFRDKNMLHLTLFIEVEGDPALTKEFNDAV